MIEFASYTVTTWWILSLAITLGSTSSDGKQYRCDLLWSFAGHGIQMVRNVVFKCAHQNCGNQGWVRDGDRNAAYSLLENCLIGNAITTVTRSSIHRVTNLWQFPVAVLFIFCQWEQLYGIRQKYLWWLYCTTVLHPPALLHSPCLADNEITWQARIVLHHHLWSYSSWDWLIAALALCNDEPICVVCVSASLWIRNSVTQY